MKKAFTLIEVLIVAAILGILAAIVLPIFSEHMTKAREATALDNLRIMRNVIADYAAKHNDTAPGYMFDNGSSTPSSSILRNQLVNGGFINAIPENPLSKKSTIRMVPNGSNMPTPNGMFGWIYKAADKNICIDLTGTDSKGMLFSDY